MLTEPSDGIPFNTVADERDTEEEEDYEEDGRTDDEPDMPGEAGTGPGDLSTLQDVSMLAVHACFEYGAVPDQETRSVLLPGQLLPLDPFVNLHQVARARVCAM